MGADTIYKAWFLHAKSLSLSSGELNPEFFPTWLPTVPIVHVEPSASEDKLDSASYLMVSLIPLFELFVGGAVTEYLF